MSIEKKVDYNLKLNVNNIYPTQTFEFLNKGWPNNYKFYDATDKKY